MRGRHPARQRYRSSVSEPGCAALGEVYTSRYTDLGPASDLAWLRTKTMVRMDPMKGVPMKAEAIAESMSGQFRSCGGSFQQLTLHLWDLTEPGWTAR